MVQFARYETASLVSNFRKRVNDLVVKGNLSESQAEALVQDYAAAASWSTYLE
jgi:polyhydroxyalkanoate synthesis regulator phasin